MVKVTLYNIISWALRDLQLLSANAPCEISYHAIRKWEQFNPSSKYDLPTLFIARDDFK